MKINLLKKSITFFLMLVFFGLVLMPAIEASSLPNYSLPLPIDVDMTVEESIFRRMSVREFTDESVTDEELSTILWAAYGLRDDGNRSVYEIDGIHAAVIYVLKENAAYSYDSFNHSLTLYKEGDFRDIVGCNIVPLYSWDFAGIQTKPTNATPVLNLGKSVRIFS